jgi:hypothetical protein
MIANSQACAATVNAGSQNSRPAKIKAPSYRRPTKNGQALGLSVSNPPALYLSRQPSTYCAPFLAIAFSVRTL